MSSAPLLMLALVVIVGTVFGSLARRLRLPSITGQVLAGAVMGSAGLGLVGKEAIHAIAPVTDVALGLIAVTVGAHLNVRRLRNAGRRLFLLLLTESIITPALVAGAVILIGGVSWKEALLYATVAIATAPATIIALVRESRARGVFVKTLIAAVALNNLACIFLFELARSFVVTTSAQPAGAGAGPSLSHSALGSLLLAIAIGTGTALAMAGAARATPRKQRLTTAGVVALLLSVGLAKLLHVSPLLACLFLGMVQTNLTPEKTKLVDSVFEDFEPIILTVFFTLAGLHLDLDHFSLVAVLTGVFLVGRIAGKLAAARVAMQLARAPKRVRDYLGLALMPQAGVAVGLIVLVQETPALAPIASIFSAVVLSAVTANEVVGPILTRLALNRSGEAGMDRSRLLDFLQEENIVTGMSGTTMDDIIRQLVQHLATVQHLSAAQRDRLLASVLAREDELSTCFGEGLAVPHGELDGQASMTGVMGISREGLPLTTPDGAPVHCVVLLATPSDDRQRHLEVLAALSRTVGHDPVVRARLFNADDPAHAYEALHDEEAEHFNYFLEG